MSQTLLINGRLYNVDADDDTPLLWAIRDIVGLKGTKFGCGMGLCGSCTIHIDGEATRACITPIATVVGGKKSITTIEGLSDDAVDIICKWAGAELEQEIRSERASQ